MERAAILCPVCVAFIKEGYVEWAARRATCSRCRLILVLDGELVPLSPVDGYPERLMEQPASDEASRSKALQVERSGATTRLWLPGWLGRHIFSMRVSPEVVESTGLGGSVWRRSVPLAEVIGVVPTQCIRWDIRNADKAPKLSWLVQLCQGTRRFLLLATNKTAEAMAWSAVLNHEIRLARRTRSAYRG